MQTDFQSHWHRTFHSVPEKNEGPVIVESAGYMTTDELVKLFLAEGKELEIARAEMHDFPTEEEINTELALDPTRKASFDLADFSEIKRRLDLIESEAAKEVVAAAEKEAAADKELELEEPVKPDGSGEGGK